MDNLDPIAQRKLRAEHWTHEAMYVMGCNDSVRAAAEALRHLVASDGLGAAEAIAVIDDYQKTGLRDWSYRNNLSDITDPPPYTNHGRKHTWCLQPRSKTVEW